MHSWKTKSGFRRLLRFMPIFCLIHAMACYQPSEDETAPVPENGADSIGGNDPVNRPCDFYTTEDAQLMGDRQPEIFTADGTPNRVGLCRRGGNTYGRLERMTLEEFQSRVCASATQVVLPVEGLGEAACRFGNGPITSVATYSQGLSLEVGNQREEICRQVLEGMISRLPPVEPAATTPSPTVLL